MWKVEEAYRLWLEKCRLSFRSQDELLQPFLNLPKAHGWLRRAREAQLLPIRRVAYDLDVSHPAYLKIESAELATRDGGLAILGNRG